MPKKSKTPHVTVREVGPRDGLRMDRDPFQGATARDRIGAGTATSAAGSVTDPNPTGPTGVLADPRRFERPAFAFGVFA
jgi:hypothetical protein